MANAEHYGNVLIDLLTESLEGTEVAQMAFDSLIAYCKRVGEPFILEIRDWVMSVIRHAPDTENAQVFDELDNILAELHP